MSPVVYLNCLLILTRPRFKWLVENTGSAWWTLRCAARDNHGKFIYLGYNAVPSPMFRHVTGTQGTHSWEITQSGSRGGADYKSVEVYLFLSSPMKLPFI